MKAEKEETQQEKVKNIRIAVSLNNSADRKKNVRYKVFPAEITDQTIKNAPHTREKEKRKNTQRNSLYSKEKRAAQAKKTSFAENFSADKTRENNESDKKRSRYTSSLSSSERKVSSSNVSSEDEIRKENIKKASRYSRYVLAKEKSKKKYSANMSGGSSAGSERGNSANVLETAYTENNSSAEQADIRSKAAMLSAKLDTQIAAERAKDLAAEQKHAEMVSAVKNSMKRQQFKKSFNDKQNREEEEQKRDERLRQFMMNEALKNEAEVRSADQRTQQNKKRKAQKEADSLLYKGVSAVRTVVSDISEISAAGASEAEAGAAAGNMVNAVPALAAKKAARKIADSVGFSDSDSLAGKMTGMASLIAKEYSNGNDAGEKIINATTAVPKKVVKDKVQDMAERIFLGKGSGSHKQHKSLARMKTESHRSREKNIRKEEVIRAARVEFYKKYNGVSGDILDLKKTLKESLGELGKKVMTEAVEKSKALILAVPVIFIFLIICVVAMLFFWMDNPDKSHPKKEVEILQGYVEQVGDYFDRKQIAILKGVDRFWGGFEPDRYNFKGKPHYYIEIQDQFENRWLKLENFTLEDVVALAAVKKFHELETQKAFYDGSDILLDEYILQITDDDLEDTVDLLYDIQAYFDIGHCSGCTETEKVTSARFEKEVGGSFDDDGNWIPSFEKKYLVTHKFTYTCECEHRFLKGNIINLTHLGEEFVLCRLVPMPSRDDFDSEEEYNAAVAMARGDRQVYAAYKEYIRDVLKKSDPDYKFTELPDYESEAERRRLAKLADLEDNPDGMYVCSETRDPLDIEYNQDYEYESDDPIEYESGSGPLMSSREVDLDLGRNKNRGASKDEENDDGSSGEEDLSGDT